MSTQVTEQCKNPAVFRFTWPGRDESFICAICALKLQAVANAIGLYVQGIPLEPGVDEQCRQKVRVEPAETRKT